MTLTCEDLKVIADHLYDDIRPLPQCATAMSRVREEFKAKQTEWIVPALSEPSADVDHMKAELIAFNLGKYHINDAIYRAGTEFTGEVPFGERCESVDEFITRMLGVIQPLVSKLPIVAFNFEQAKAALERYQMLKHRRWEIGRC